jgi:hypothetical protein
MPFTTAIGTSLKTSEHGSAEAMMEEVSGHRPLRLENKGINPDKN